MNWHYVLHGVGLVGVYLLAYLQVPIAFALICWVVIETSALIGTTLALHLEAPLSEARPWAIGLYTVGVILSYVLFLTGRWRACCYRYQSLWGHMKAGGLIGNAFDLTLSVLWPIVVLRLNHWRMVTASSGPWPERVTALVEDLTKTKKLPTPPYAINSLSLRLAERCAGRSLRHSSTRRK